MAQGLHSIFAMLTHTGFVGQLAPVLGGLLLLSGCHLLFGFDAAAPGADASVALDARPSQDSWQASADAPLSPDLSPDLGPDLQRQCRPEDLPAICDPYEPDDPQACPEGSCYLVPCDSGRGVMPACVFPVGERATNSPCKTTIECKPGLVCAQLEVDSGECRPLCTPATASSDCDWWQDCVPVLQAEEYGYCASCSAEGRAAGCSPLKGTGCIEGSCYLLAGGFGQPQPSCVCPQGSAAADAPCSQTQQCQPGLVCVASSGTCRPLCLTYLDCQTSTDTCSEISTTGYGYCESS